MVECHSDFMPYEMIQWGYGIKTFHVTGIVCAPPSPVPPSPLSAGEGVGGGGGVEPSTQFIFLCHN